MQEKEVCFLLSRGTLVLLALECTFLSIACMLEGIESHLSDLQAKRTLVPQTPFKRLKVSYLRKHYAQYSNSMRTVCYTMQMGECTKDPVQDYSAMPTAKAVQPCFDRFSYTPVTKQQGLPPGTSSISPSELGSLPTLERSTVDAMDDSELDDFDWGYDDPFHIRGDTARRDAQLNTRSDNKEPSHRRVAPDVVQKNSQYFEDQRNYEMSYVDGINGGFLDSCGTSIEATCFDWIDDEDNQSLEQDEMISFRRTRDWSLAHVPVAARTPQLQAPRLCKSVSIGNSATIRFWSFTG